MAFKASCPAERVGWLMLSMERQLLYSTFFLSFLYIYIIFFSYDQFLFTHFTIIWYILCNRNILSMTLLFLIGSFPRGKMEF